MMHDNTSVLNSPKVDLRRRPWTVLLAGLVLVQLVLVALVYWPRERNVAADMPLLPEVSADNVTEITITDDSGQSIQLVREAETWVLAGTDGFPVRDDTVTTLLGKVTGLRTNRLVASSATSQQQLAVSPDNFSRRIDLSLSDGNEETLYIGTSPRARATHVRADGRPEIFLASDLSSFDTNARPSDWIDTIYFQIPSEQVVKMTLTNSNGEFVFAKDEEGTWHMEGLAEGESFNDNNLESLLTSLSGLAMVAPLGKTAQPTYGLDDPSAVVTVITSDENGEETTHHLQIGAQEEANNRYYVSSSDSPYIVQVANHTVERFLQRSRADFITVPEPVEEETDAAPDSESAAEEEPSATAE